MKRLKLASCVGFTLLELAIVLVMVSLMTGFAAQAIQATIDGNCYEKTRTQIKEVDSALIRYVRANGRFPMPAPRNLGTVGTEVALATDANIDRVSGVLIGAIPYTTLGLNASYGSDCWGNKFSYFVTEEFTATSTHSTTPSSGGDVVVKLDGGTILTSSAAYAVVSHGQSPLGASKYNFLGSVVSLPERSKRDCNAAQIDGNVHRLDKENCDTNDNVVFQADFNNGTNESSDVFFDDIVVYGVKSGYSRCIAGTATWNTNCSAPIDDLPHGGSITLTNTAGGYEGTAIASCENGVLSYSSNSCNSMAGRSFSIAPAVGGKVVWNLDVDGKLTLSTAGTWTIVPSSSFSATAKAWGAGGNNPNNGSYTGGAGGYAGGTVSFISGTTYILTVGGEGQQGVNNGVGGTGAGGTPGGGGAGGNTMLYGGGGGGGYSGIHISAGADILIAGGGGGGGWGGDAGAGGNTTGQNGTAWGSANGGSGGSQLAGGAGGTGPSSNGNAGAVHQGGAGCTAGGGASVTGGGGGGGYYGGGSGGCEANAGSGGGGGGSSYYHATHVTSVTLNTGNLTTPGNSGDGDRGTGGNQGAAGRLVLN